MAKSVKWSFGLKNKNCKTTCVWSSGLNWKKLIFAGSPAGSLKSGSPAGSLKSKLDFQGKIVGGQEAEPRKC